MDPVIEGYATAIFEVARAEGALEQVEDELFRFSRIVEQEPKLREALRDIAIPPEQRAKMVQELLGKRTSPHTVNLISFIVLSGHAREMGPIIEAFTRKAAAERNRALAEVRSAVPLDADQRANLAEAIKRATGRDVEMKVLVDPNVIGGLLVRVGDQVFDATVRHRLQLAKERLGTK
jgi:F-type H+-transporting ATPase subunit delta